MDTNKEINQFTEEELKEIAAQLSRPNGDFGIKIAESMTETNMVMIHNTIDLLKLKHGRFNAIGIANPISMERLSYP
jgi:hypothetical protein